MKKLSAKFAVSLLAFGIGIAFAGLFYAGSGGQAAEHPVGGTITGTSETGVSNAKNLEMVFVLDTTGSMGGLLDGAKQRIWGIINEVMQKESKPKVRVGLVAYRDRGDEYVTQVLPITDDLDAVYSKLMELNASGGGDGPEDVRRALAEGLSRTGWSKPRSGLAQIIFLVGDAPPHDYQNEPDVMVTAGKAAMSNIIVNTIQCGDQGDTRDVWQRIAQRGQGKYFAIAQNGGVDAVGTPFDERLSQLGQKLGNGYLAYGDVRSQEVSTAAVAGTEANMNTAPAAARAERALNKALNSEAYRGDLLLDIENKKITLDGIDKEHLPVDLRDLSAAERKREIERRIQERRAIRSEIVELSKKRDAFIADVRAKAGKQNGFDSAVAAALAEQLAKRGIK